MPPKETTEQKTTETDISAPKPEPEEIQETKGSPVEETVTLPPKNIITVHEEILQTPAHIDGRQVLGLYEQASLPDLELDMAAKMDTGAKISSIDAPQYRTV